MMKKSYDIKDNIIEEIKKLALDISLIKSVIELINDYHKVQLLYEKVTFLKILIEESIDIDSIKNEFEEIKYNEKDSNLEHFFQKKIKFISNYKIKEKDDEYFEKRNKVINKEDIPVILEDIEEVTNFKIENIFEKDHLEEDIYSCVNIPKENKKKDSINSVQDKIVNISEDCKVEIAEISLCKDKVFSVDDGENTGFKYNNYEEQNLTSVNIEEDTKNIDKIVQIKGEEIYNNNISKEKFTQKKVKLSPIKGVKKIVIEKLEENIKLERNNNNISPIDKLVSIRMRPLRIDFNDRVAFLKRLFSNNVSEMKIVLDKLNELQTIDEAKVFFNKMYYEKYWKSEYEYAQRLWLLVERRFR